MRVQVSGVGFQGPALSVPSYRDLLVWQKGMRLAAEAYRLGRRLPQAEEDRLTSQLLRAAASVPAHFVSIARGSLAETETILLLLVDVDLLTNEHVDPV